MKKIYSFTASILLMGLSMFAQPSGWSKAVPITVTNPNAVATTDYQLHIILDTQTPIGAGDMLANGDDIRFGKTCSGATLFNYWIESGINTTSTSIWVRIDSVPASSSFLFFLFYGNSGATAVSAINGTFWGPLSSTDSVASGSAGGVGNSQRGFRFSPNEDILVTSFGKNEPTGTTRYVTLFDFNTQAIINQNQVAGPAGQYSYSNISSPVWLTQNTQYLLELYQDVNDGYYFGSSSQINPRLTYYDMRYCNSCGQNTFPTNTLSNYQYGYPDLWFYAKNNSLSITPVYSFSSINITGTNTITAGQSTTLTASGVPNYTWSANAGGLNTASVSLNPTSTTVYTVYGTDGNGCNLNAVDTVFVLAEALNFDGNDDYIDCSNILGASYTKEAWIYITNLGLMNNIISGDDNLGTHAFWAPSANSNMLSAGHNGNWFAVEDNTPLLANTWYHVAVTYDSASQTMNLYKNGTLVSTNTNVANFSNGSQTYIGSYNQAQNSFGGNIDEVRIWNRALCQGEIMNNMNGGLTLPQNGLVAYYKFNQGIDGVNNATVTTAADSSGNSNNGTLTNFALTGTTSNWVAPGAITAGNYASAFVNPTITISGDSVICSGTSTTLTVNGNVNTYTWSTSDNTASAVVAPTTDASYSVTASNNGCVSNTAVTTITVNALPVINSQSGSVHICGDTTGIFNVASNDITDTYQWNWFNVSTPNSLSALSGTYGDVGYATNNLSIHQLLTNGWGPSGEYGVNCVITNTANCSITSQPDTIFVNDLPTVTASVTTPTLCLGSIDTLIAAGATMYMWSANAGSVMNDSAFVSPTADDTYTVTGTDVNGCTNTSTVQIMVTSCSSGIKQIANRNISIYPNPTSGSFTIQSDKELGKITVYDMLNREVYTINANQTKATINIENLVSGVYYVNIAGSTIKVVKQ